MKSPSPRSPKPPGTTKIRIIGKIIPTKELHCIGGRRMKKMIPLLKSTNLYDDAIRRYQELLQLKQVKENAITKAPPGKIHISHNKNHEQFYLRENRDEKTGEYISKSNSSKLKSYLQKSYDEKALKLINQEIAVLELFLRKSNCFAESSTLNQSNHFDENSTKNPLNHPIENRTQSQANHINKGKKPINLIHPVVSIQQIYSSYPEEAKKYINPIDMSDEDYVKHWLNIPYDGKGILDYVPYYETDRKERVRSKSELNIANALAVKGIPYKYECPLLFKNGFTIYPDFTVLNVKERRVKYWEHRGMMDDKDYAKNAVSRIKTYVNNGYYLGIDLIITEETSSSPLGTDEIDAVIKKYF